MPPTLVTGIKREYICSLHFCGIIVVMAHKSRSKRPKGQGRSRRRSLRLSLRLKQDGGIRPGVVAGVAAALGAGAAAQGMGQNPSELSVPVGNQVARTSRALVDPRGPGRLNTVRSGTNYSMNNIFGNEVGQYAPSLGAIGAPGQLAIGAPGQLAIGAPGQLAIGAPGQLAIGAPGTYLNMSQIGGPYASGEVARTSSALVDPRGPAPTNTETSAWNYVWNGNTFVANPRTGELPAPYQSINAPPGGMTGLPPGVEIYNSETGRRLNGSPTPTTIVGSTNPLNRMPFQAYPGGTNISTGPLVPSEPVASRLPVPEVDSPVGEFTTPILSPVAPASVAPAPRTPAPIAPIPTPARNRPANINTGRIGSVASLRDRFESRARGPRSAPAGIIPPSTASSVMGHYIPASPPASASVPTSASAPPRPTATNVLLPLGAASALAGAAAYGLRQTGEPLLPPVARPGPPVARPGPPVARPGPPLIRPIPIEPGQRITAADLNALIGPGLGEQKKLLIAGLPDIERKIVGANFGNLNNNIDATKYDTVYITSDIHADLRKFMSIITTSGLAVVNGPRPYNWTTNDIYDYSVYENIMWNPANPRTLFIIVGDLIDGKREFGRNIISEVEDPQGTFEILLLILLYNLRLSARRYGSEVLFTMGNHCIEPIGGIETFLNPLPNNPGTLQFFKERSVRWEYSHETAKQFFNVGPNSNQELGQALNIWNNSKECFRALYSHSPYIFINLIKDGSKEVSCIHAGFHVYDGVNNYQIKLDQITDIQNLINRKPGNVLRDPDVIQSFRNILINGSTNDSSVLWNRIYAKQPGRGCRLVNGSPIKLTVVGHCPTHSYQNTMHDGMEKGDYTGCGEEKGCVVVRCSNPVDGPPRLALVDVGMSAAFFINRLIKRGITRPVQILKLIHDPTKLVNERYYNVIIRATEQLELGRPHIFVDDPVVWSADPDPAAIVAPRSPPVPADINAGLVPRPPPVAPDAGLVQRPRGRLRAGPKIGFKLGRAAPGGAPAGPPPPPPPPARPAPGDPINFINRANLPPKYHNATLFEGFAYEPIDYNYLINELHINVDPVFLDSTGARLAKDANGTYSTTLGQTTKGDGAELQIWSKLLFRIPFDEFEELSIDEQYDFWKKFIKLWNYWTEIIDAMPEAADADVKRKLLVLNVFRLQLTDEGYNMLVGHLDKILRLIANAGGFERGINHIITGPIKMFMAIEISKIRAIDPNIPLLNNGIAGANAPKDINSAVVLFTAGDRENYFNPIGTYALNPERNTNFNPEYIRRNADNIEILETAFLYYKIRDLKIITPAGVIISPSARTIKQDQLADNSEPLRFLLEKDLIVDMHPQLMFLINKFQPEIMGTWFDGNMRPPVVPEAQRDLFNMTWFAVLHASGNAISFDNMIRLYKEPYINKRNVIRGMIRHVTDARGDFIKPIITYQRWISDGNTLRPADFINTLNGLPAPAPYVRPDPRLRRVPAVRALPVVAPAAPRVPTPAPGGRVPAPRPPAPVVAPPPPAPVVAPPPPAPVVAPPPPAPVIAPPPPAPVIAPPPPAPVIAPPPPAPPPPAQKTFNLDMIRHGFSCANLEKGIRQKSKGFSMLGAQLGRVIKSTAEGKDPVLSNIGISQALQLRIMLQRKEYPVVFASYLRRSIETALIVFGDPSIVRKFFPELNTAAYRSSVVPRINYPPIKVIPYISEERAFGGLDIENESIGLPALIAWYESQLGSEPRPMPPPGTVRNPVDFTVISARDPATKSKPNITEFLNAIDNSIENDGSYAVVSHANVMRSLHSKISNAATYPMGPSSPLNTELWPLKFTYGPRVPLAITYREAPLKPPSKLAITYDMINPSDKDQMRSFGARCAVTRSLKGGKRRRRITRRHKRRN